MKSAWFRGIETEVNPPLRLYSWEKGVSAKSLIFIRFLFKLKSLKRGGNGTIAAEKSPEELTAAIQALLEQNEDYKKLKTVPGFSLEYTVTPEKKLLSTSVIDLNQIDAKSLEEISYFKDAGLNDLKNMKADALVKALKLHGMKEEGQ